MLRFTTGSDVSRTESVKFDKDRESKDETIVDEHARQIHVKFTQGNYDASIFCDNPQLTDDLKILASKYNRDFVQRLFTKCNSDACLLFWLEEADVKLPKDSVALVVALHNNEFAVNYLIEKGWFENLQAGDKIELLKRAERFPGKGLECLKKVLASARPKPTNTLS